MTGMTGFGHGEHRDEKVHLVLEMRSYNNRFLELYLNLPYGLRPLEPRFRELTDAYDGFPPDGMPLVWCLRLAGAGLRDRVYGPTFMRQFLSSVPKEFTHYLLGGSEECGARLREVFGRLNPGIRFVGSFHGKCAPDGRMEGAADEAVDSVDEGR